MSDADTRETFAWNKEAKLRADDAGEPVASRRIAPKSSARQTLSSLSLGKGADS